jgi:hypothetical protein
MLNCIVIFVSKWKFLRGKRRVSKTKMFTLIFRRYLVKIDPNKLSRWFRYIDRKAPERRSNITLARPNGFPILKPKPSFITKASFYEPFDRTKLAKLALEYKSNKFKKEIYSKCDYKCQRCQNNLLDSNLVPEIHHKLPVYLGGSNKKSNLVLVCQPCHKFIHKVLIQKNNDEIQSLVASGLLILN